MGRIHTSGASRRAASTADIEWVVVGNGIVDISENELEIWYSPQDRFAVSVRPPGSAEWIGPVEPRQFIENRAVADGSFVQHLQRAVPPGQRRQLHRRLPQPVPLARRGGRRPGRHAGRCGCTASRCATAATTAGSSATTRARSAASASSEAWRFPSFFSERSNVDNSSVSSLACGQRVISVANLDEAAERINITSSQGPTRDGRFKPDVAAPGTDIVAAKGFAGRDDLWVAMTGTSMASPFVAGVAGLMLASTRS